ncbi:MAG: phospho-sugar mutase [Bacteroidota bacterium]|nr:phospho-sugar mutase [Bacteroidota bacterium]
METDKQILARANKWLEGNFDEETKDQVRNLIANDPDGLTDAFYRDLEFGTGGLRGIMGAGTNRMNKYTVGMATQGLANYLKKTYSREHELRIVIAYDSRNNSKLFAKTAAEVLSANHIRVFLFEELRPTPLLSFAVRELNCQSGIVITASHNPKEYNGYKVYWKDGGQLVAPHDKNIIAEVLQIESVEDVKWKGDRALIEHVGKNIDDIYVERVKSLALSPDARASQKDMKIVYTPIHGTGITLVPRCLAEFGFEKVSVVQEQAVPDGNFPTVISPNPEEATALNLALLQAKKLDADLVLATDPDADRVGVAVKDHHGEFVLLNGNQTASVLTYYLLSKWKENGKLTGKEYIVKTIVTSELLKDIAVKNDVHCYDVLTGFKYIAETIHSHEGIKTFIGGGEESYGYLVGDFVRDKDAVIACCMIAEAAAWAASRGKSFFELLIEMYAEFGLYKEKLKSVTLKGKEGAEQIKAMMVNYRNTPPAKIAGQPIVEIRDYLLSKTINLKNETEKKITLPKSDVIQFFLADGSKITVRPSGTEPKIKFYFGVKALLANKEAFDKVNEQLDQKVEQIIQSLGV